MENRRPGSFTIGNTAKKGKPSPGSGRHPDWLKEKCQALISKHKLIEFLADVANGHFTEVEIAPGGKELLTKRSCGAETRMKAVAMLLERGYGKPAQAVEVAGKDGGELKITVVSYA